MTGEYLELTAPRLRALEARDLARHGRFWQGVAIKAAADAAVLRVGGKA